MQTVGPAFRRHRLGCGGQRLAQYLPAENVAKPQILALPPEDIFLDHLKFQQGQELSQDVDFNANICRHRFSLLSHSVVSASSPLPSPDLRAGPVG